MFSSKHLSVVTLKNHLSAIRQPFFDLTGLSVDPLDERAFLRACFRIRPPPRQLVPQWSLQRVLALLKTRRFSPATASPLSLLRKALFLMALATGDRVPELAAMSRHRNCLRFAPLLASVSIAPDPQFIAKNEHINHIFTPFEVPALKRGCQHHALCPVKSLHTYMAGSDPVDPTHLWVSSTTGQRLHKRRISVLLASVIKEAHPGVVAKCHDIRKWASTLRFLRNCSLDDIAQTELWSSNYTFLSRYLALGLDIPHTPCIALRTRIS